MGRLTKAKLPAKARRAARTKGIVLAEPVPTTDCESPNKSLPEVAGKLGHFYVASIIFTKNYKILHA